LHSQSLLEVDGTNVCDFYAEEGILVRCAFVRKLEKNPGPLSQA